MLAVLAILSERSHNASNRLFCFGIRKLIAEKLGTPGRTKVIQKSDRLEMC
jgi:hypothetical protein